jgi:hypothetical protein
MKQSSVSFKANVLVRRTARHFIVSKSHHYARPVLKSVARSLDIELSKAEMLKSVMLL